MILPAPGLHLGDPWGIGVAFAGGVLLVAVGALSHAHERPFSAAIVYLALGAAASAMIAATGLPGRVTPLDDHLLLERLTDAAVALAVFGTGMRVRRALSVREWQSPLRMLGLAMPLTAALVALWGWGLMGLSAGAAIVLGAALSPTDPVLAGGLGLKPPEEQQEERSPEPQFTLATEAGFNDGLGLPFLLLGLTVAAHGTARLGTWAWSDLAYGVVVALALGAVLGYGIGGATLALRERGWFDRELSGWVGVASALLIYGAAEALGSFGFVAAMAGGVAFRRYEVGHEYKGEVHRGTAIAETFGELIVVVVIGAMLTTSGLGVPGWAGWLLVPALLLAMRPLATAVALARAPMPAAGRAYVAWFGVKGVASLNYVAVAVASGAVPGGQMRTIAWTVIAAIVVSIVVHGASADPVGVRLLRAAGATRR